MCGIVGVLKRAKKYTDTNEIRQMMQALQHRGPDDKGLCAVFADEKKVREIKTHLETLAEPASGFLGFQRLRVLDLTKNGNQPMLDASEKKALVYNGEIYNVWDYKQELEQAGYPLKSRTDTELLFHMLRRYGVSDTARKLNGMFAFAYLDMEEETLYLVRDRYGIKPLYYTVQDDGMMFASEMKAFLFAKAFHPEINIAAYRECAVFGYAYGQTLLKNVCELMPGMILKYHLATGQLEISSYFDINAYTRVAERSCSVKETRMRLSEKIEQAVKKQLMRDVKLGCQLSGGVDSSLITYYAARNDASVLDGISVIFDPEYKAYSEESYIDQVQKITQIHTHKTVLSKDYYIRTLGQLIWHLETIPKFYNESGIMRLAEEAGKHVTVLLSGEGADELFCGYDWMQNGYMVDLGERKGVFVRKCLEKIGTYAYYFKGRAHSLENYILYAADAVPVQIAKKLLPAYEEEPLIANRKKRLQSLTGSLLDRQIKYEMSVRLPALFNRQDKTTMAHSVENRVPFLDNALVDYAFQIPEACIVKNRYGKKKTGKYILKKISETIYGRAFSFREKNGFAVPVMDFIQSEPMRQILKDRILPNMKTRGILNAEYVGSLMQKGPACDYWETYALFMAICLEIWAEIFIDRTSYDKIIFREG